MNGVDLAVHHVHRCVPDFSPAFFNKGETILAVKSEDFPETLLASFAD